MSKISSRFQNLDLDSLNVDIRPARAVSSRNPPAVTLTLNEPFNALAPAPMPSSKHGEPFEGCKQPSKVAAYLRAYAFLVLQLAAATAMIIAVLGANWMQIDNSLKTAASGPGLIRTAGFWQACYATPEDHLRGSGTWQDQLHDIVTWNKGICSSDPAAFFKDLWKLDWTIYFQITRAAGVVGAAAAFLVFALGSSLNFYHLAKFGPDFCRAWNSYPCFYSFLGIVTSITTVVMVTASIGAVSIWAAFVILVARAGKDAGLGFLSHGTDYAGAAYWLYVAGTGISLLAPVMMQI